MELDRKTCDRARRSRDPRFDGRFFICVTTTGIYCRPICPSRTSKDENVRYVATAAAAQAAGFRPCLRCRPEASPGTPAWRGTSSIVSRALRLISEGALDEGNVEALAERLGVTSRHLGRLFVRHLGATPFDLGLTRRAHFAKKHIDETTIPFEEVAYAAGFGSVRRFNEDIRIAFSRTPTELRRLARQRGPTAPGRYMFRLAYRPPYDWHAAMRFLDAHSVHGVERVEPDRYLRTIELDGRTGTILVTPAAAGAALDVEVRFPDTRALLGVVERVRRMFDLAADPAVIAHQLRQDPQLRSALVAHPGIRCVRPWDGFELAVRALLDDRIVVDGVAASFGTRVDAGPLQRVFPTPTQIQDAPLERIGVAEGRAESIRQLARAVLQGAIRFAGSDAATLASALAAIPRARAWRSSLRRAHSMSPMPSTRGSGVRGVARLRATSKLGRKRGAPGGRTRRCSSGSKVQSKRKRKFARPLTALVATLAILAVDIGCKGAGRRDMSKLVEFRSYTLRRGVRPAFHRRFVEQSHPMLQRWDIDAVAYGPSPQDENSYFLIRAYPSLPERERSESTFYGSNEWRNGPRAAVLADIESYTTFILTLDTATLESLRAAGREQLKTVEATMQQDEADTTTTDRERLLRLNEDYIASYLNADVAWYREHLAEDFICIESDGSVQDKAAFLVDCAKGPDVASYNLAETTFRVYGNTALVQARAVFTRRDGSKGTSRYTDVWVRTTANQWSTVSAQITRSAL